MTDDEKNWLAADYVLGVLRGPEKLAFEQQMRNDTVLARSVLDWQTRLSLIDGQGHAFMPSMSEADIDAALGQVFERVCKAIDAQPEAGVKLNNPLSRLSREQLGAMRPAVVRMIASYLVLLERLKAQQARMASSTGLA
ncbi:MAG TPA: hypothetical protein VGE55_09990 [Limnobacter sp.]|uniref:hypothetical protein n=1 Tax=Limnobacter sp. TaxID=2003368 RepID=UPI002ED80B65